MLGIEDENITDREIRLMIRKAKKENKDSIKIKGVKITLKRNKYGHLECGILD